MVKHVIVFDDLIGFCTDKRVFYHVSKRDIERRGLSFWLEHLDKKGWFTERARDEFLDRVENHIEWIPWEGSHS